MTSDHTLDDRSLRTQVLETISDCLAASGLSIQDIPDGVGLIDHVSGFDSLMAVEATVALEERLKIKLGEDSIFVEDRPGRASRARTLTAVINVLLARCK